MAKRSSSKKKSSTPNISQAALDQAKREMQANSGDADSLSAAEARERAARRAERAARRAQRRQQQTTGERPQKRDDLNASVMEEMLSNPTHEVTREELQAQYGYVIEDLRNMGILAAALFAVLIGLGFLL
jgi:hypothetical protein